MSSIPQAIAAAVAHHQAGRFGQAEQIYRQVLQTDPRHPDALHLLGVIAYQCGRHEPAVERIEQALAVNPDNGTFHNNLGNALQALGRFDEAVSHHQRAIELQPENPDAHNNCGNALQKLGRLDEAVASFERALALRPNFPDAHSNLGIVRKAQGNLPEAIACHRKSLRLRPDSPEVLGNLAHALQLQGELDEAIACYQQSLQLRRDRPEVCNNLGSALIARGRFEEAAAVFRQGTEIAPQYMDAHVGLGNALRLQWKLDEAAAAHAHAVELDPESTAALNGLGATRKVQGRLDEAIECFQRVIELTPEFVDAHTNLGNTYQDQGRLEEAAACFERAIEIDPACAQALSQGITLARQQRQPISDERITAIKQLLAKDDLPAKDGSMLCYALGNFFDGRKDYDDAFEHYRRGNELRRKVLKERDFNDVAADELREWAGAAISTFDRNYFERVASSGSQSDRPVFVVGMPRSGTTLIEQILSAHPEVFGAGELHNIDEISRRLAEQFAATASYPACMSQVDGETIRRHSETYLNRLAELGGDAARVIDKMPLNYKHLALIATLLPDARVIHCRRDPLDTCLSSFMQIAIPMTLEELGLVYRQYETLMAHWREVLPLRIHEVVYEELVADVETASRELVEFCGIEWDDRCLTFYEQDRDVQTPSKLQVRQPIYTSSIGRWKKYQAHLGPLIESLNLSTDDLSTDGT